MHLRDCVSTIWHLSILAIMFGVIAGIGWLVRNSDVHTSHAHARRAYYVLHGTKPRTINTWFASRWNSRARDWRVLVDRKLKQIVDPPEGKHSRCHSPTACTHGCNACKLMVDANAYANNTRVRGLPAIRNWHLSRRAGRNRVGRGWRTCLHRYPCNYGFIENDASPQHISPLWRVPFP